MLLRHRRSASSEQSKWTICECSVVLMCYLFGPEARWQRPSRRYLITDVVSRRTDQLATWTTKTNHESHHHSSGLLLKCMTTSTIITPTRASGDTVVGHVKRCQIKALSNHAQHPNFPPRREQVLSPNLKHAQDSMPASPLQNTMASSMETSIRPLEWGSHVDEPRAGTIEVLGQREVRSKKCVLQRTAISIDIRSCKTRLTPCS